MSNWSSLELITAFGESITRWHAKGYGKTRCAKLVSEQSGRPCTTGVMAHVFNKLELKRGVAEKLEVKDTSDPYEEQPIEELIQSRIKAANRKKSQANKHKRTIELPAEPVGIYLAGDPHVDNEGCDWGKLFEHVQIVQSTRGVLAACVGDMQDHWVGRLARCYADSSAKASDGWRLSEWYLSSMQWIALVGGNHDSWASTHGLDPYDWLTKKCGVMCYAADEIRLTLRWKNEPDLEPIIWVLRHDFSGRSWFHPTHGPHKEATLDGKAHLLTAGHIHQWGELTTEQRHGRCTTALRVRGYKKNDNYARQKGFSEQEHGEAALIVIDPWVDGPQRITTFWDVRKGCDYLRFLRREIDGEE